MLARVAEFAVALISAGAAILGAIVGGYMTARATARLEEKKQGFERERDSARELRAQEQELKLARATALALYPRYLAAAATFHVALDANRFWQPSVEIPDPTSFEDRKLLAAHMSRQDRELVVRGELMLQRVLEQRKHSAEWSDTAAEAIRDAEKRVEAAWRALKTFGETPAAPS
jgi:hypothetical protein